ncbi:MAG: hypothetical protein ACTSV2_18370, partial [Candidatus Thorarchaeota archaeon]
MLEELQKLEERLEQMLHRRGMTAMYLLSVISGIGLNVLYFLYTFYIPQSDPFFKLIHLMLSVGLVITTVAFAYLNKNFLRILLLFISMALAGIHVFLSWELFGTTGLFMAGWYFLSLFLLFITFKWLKIAEEGQQVSQKLRKNWSYYCTMVLGLSLIAVFLGAVWFSQTANELFKFVLMADSGLL